MIVGMSSVNGNRVLSGIPFVQCNILTSNFSLVERGASHGLVSRDQTLVCGMNYIDLGGCSSGPLSALSHQFSLKFPRIQVPESTVDPPSVESLPVKRLQCVRQYTVLN